MLKNNKDFDNDYSFDRNNDCKIDMVLSGKYLDSRVLNLDINTLDLDEYPNDKRLNYLKELIADKYKKSSDNFVLGAASNGIIQNLVKIFFAKGGTLLVNEFSFAQPEYATRRIGGLVKKVSANKDFTINFEDFYKSIDDDVKAIFLCNPNNPTGYYIEPLEIINFAKKINIPLIVSEAAIEFTKNKSLLDFELPENVIVTRTFSKAYGLAGLRIGYGYLSGRYLELYKNSITRFEVSILSVEVAIQMLESISIDNNVAQVIKERDYITKELRNMGIDVLDSCSNIVMSKNVYHKDFYELLKEHGITVAKVDSIYDDYYYFRVAIQKKDVNKKFITEMKKVKLLLRKYQK